MLLFVLRIIFKWFLTIFLAVLIKLLITFITQLFSGETQLIHYLDNSLTTLQIIHIKLKIILYFLPLIGCLVLVGIVDGLVQRHLRKLRGARESSGIYHLAKSAVLPSFLMSQFLYLLLPTTIHFNIVCYLFLSCAAVCSIALSITLRSFKKYF